MSIKVGDGQERHSQLLELVDQPLPLGRDADQDAPASARVAAARGVLEIDGRLREEAELGARLGELERALDARGEP
jgi:hypothetical protein